MKLIHEGIIDCDFDFTEDHFINLVIERPDTFFEYSNELYLQIEKNTELGWVLSNNNQEEKLNKNMIFIYDYYNIELSGKKITSLINQTILDTLKEGDYYEKFAVINNEILSLSQDVLANIDLPLETGKEFFYEDLIKIIDIKINEDISLVEKLITYIDIYIKIKRIKIVCFINLYSILSVEDIKKIIKQLEYMQIKALFIDNCLKYRIDNIKTIIIDNDLCVI